MLYLLLHVSQVYAKINARKILFNGNFCYYVSLELMQYIGILLPDYNYICLFDTLNVALILPSVY